MSKYFKLNWCINIKIKPRIPYPYLFKSNKVEKNATTPNVTKKFQCTPYSLT